VAVDEQETEPIASVGGREAPQQEGTIPADDQREVPVVEDQRDRIPDAGHHLAESLRIDDVGFGVAFRRRAGQRDVPVVVHVRTPGWRRRVIPVTPSGHATPSI
jgi:hypothetical protein